MTGAEAALPIWVSFMKKATEQMPVRDFDIPDGIVTAVIDPSTGAIATSACPMTETELFIAGTEPTSQCTEHTYSYYAYRDHHSEPYRWHSQRREEPRRYSRPRQKKKWWRKLKFWD